MSTTSNPKGMQMPTVTTTAGGESRRDAQKLYRIEHILWFVGLVIFIISCFVIHTHPQAYPFDLATTQSVQAFSVPAWINAVLEFPSTLNDPLPSTIAICAWVVFMLLMALISKLKRKSPLGWLQAVAFLAVTVMASAGLNVVIDELVNRPRPNPHTQPIHVYTPIVPFPTYPSGHTEHDIVYYGFLLYLSLTKPVREWRYHWLLLPLQIYAIFDILSIGYSRILEGDHWLTDVLGGYLEGAIYLFFFIFLYRKVTEILARRHAGKIATQIRQP